MVNKIKLKTHISALFLAVLMSLLVRPTEAFSEVDFYYYNPDSVQSNLSALKKGMDMFLQELNFTSSFQAFSQKIDFDRMIADKQPALVFVPVWYYQEYGTSLRLQAFLTPSSAGKTSYYKVLLVRKNAALALADLAGKTVAMTTMGTDTERKFSSMFQQRYEVDLSKSNIIITPKDADALYALALGQVDAALVSSDTLLAVGDANRRIVEMVKELAFSEPLPMPVLCVTKGKLEELVVHRLEQVFKEGGKRSSRPVFMQMLRIDDWQTIN